ncbi:hypothetical protein [Moorena sp. SIO3I6]|nr:hypothetical protein [Moorena sp. SIO3I6]NEP24526.1 hypothetical protein [Moorena sp. SIO3I6]
MQFDPLGGMGILPVTIGRAIPTLATRRTIPKVAVRYGTGYPNTGYEAEN